MKSIFAAAAALVLTHLSGLHVGAQGVATAPAAPESRRRVRFIGPSVRAMNEYETDYESWVFGEGNSTSTTIGDVRYMLKGSKLEGGWNRIVYARWVPHLGERLAAAGITATEGSALSLSITGLPEGTHSLKAWHNAWDDLDAIATLDITVDDEQFQQGAEQTVRIDNIWGAATSYVTFDVASANQTVTVTYTPSAGGDKRAFLNGFEVDGGPSHAEISFPVPQNLDERVLADNGTFEASWAPAEIDLPTYNVYLGTSENELAAVGTGLSDTSVPLEGLSSLDAYYWRVDAVSGNTTYIGRTWMFRVAQLAFPGAEGHGRFARGGRGGKVIHVTSLEDDGEGSFRQALTAETGPRIIVFDVGGVITLKSRLTLNTENGRYVTVAGQTAPWKGIVIQGWPVGLSGANDIVFRHMRVRPGKSSGETVDGMGMAGSNYAIFDRCSMGWGIDECFSSRTAHNITFQRSMISEPLNIAGHENYPEGTEHGYAATIGGDVGSFHHNLIAHAEGRSWSMGGGVDFDSKFAGRLDIRNNVVYNFGDRVTDGGAMQVNFVGNLYKQGPASNLTYALQATYEDAMPGSQQYHCAGNSMPGVFDQYSEQYIDDGEGQSKNIACYAEISIDPGPMYQKFFAEPFFESYIDEQTSTEAYKRVLSDSGASQPVIDDHDKRIVEETITGTTTYTGSSTGKKGIIDDPADVGGLEEFPTATRPPTWDADGDGIADWWDGSTGGDGWTPLEGYLNFMADPHAFVEPSAAVEVDLLHLASGFVSPTFKVSGAAKGTASVSGSTLTYEAGADAGIDRLTVDISDGEGSTWSRTLGFTVFAGASEA